MAVGAHRDGRSRNHSETPNRRLVMEQRYPSPSFANRWLRAVRTAPFNGGRSRSTTSQMRGPLILSYSCRKRFPMPRIRAQGRPGQRPLRLWPQLAGRFTDSFQTALDCVVRLGILNEGTAVHARSGTFDCVPRRHEQPLPLHFVAPAASAFLHLPVRLAVRAGRQAATRCLPSRGATGAAIRQSRPIGQYPNPGAAVATRRGPKHKQTHHADCPKFRLVAAQCSNAMIAVHGYRSLRCLRRASRTSSTR
jgi:hypothetical protein